MPPPFIDRRHKKDVRTLHCGELSGTRAEGEPNRRQRPCVLRHIGAQMRAICAYCSYVLKRNILCAQNRRRITNAKRLYARNVPDCIHCNLAERYVNIVFNARNKELGRNVCADICVHGAFEWFNIFPLYRKARRLRMAAEFLKHVLEPAQQFKQM
ncbi:hypothetical protein SDC9_189135 [bioreactor metagenome]|uniref:Uncharacterized protein n=1 Tax=bioreactor metagenome TaxID=1076179 RepID=A0A645HRA3_9ZZZZ